MGVADCATDRHMKQRKAQIIKARVSTNMKRGIEDLADQRGESEAVISILDSDFKTGEVMLLTPISREKFPRELDNSCHHL